MGRKRQKRNATSNNSTHTQNINKTQNNHKQDTHTKQHTNTHNIKQKRFVTQKQQQPNTHETHTTQMQAHTKASTNTTT